MEPRKYRVFTLAHMIIYGGMCLGVLAACLKVVHFNKWQLPLASWATMSAAVLGFLGITAQLIRVRLKFVKSIAFYTKHGIAVIPGPVANWFSVTESKETIEKTIDETVGFWASYLQVTTDKLYSYFNGGVISFQTDLLVWHGRGEYSGFTKIAVGMASGNQIGMRWTAGDPFPRDLLKHEAAHVCLNAVGQGGNEVASHNKMANAGWNF